MTLLNNIGALTQAFDQEMEEDPRVVLYGEDAGFEGGVFRATKGLQEKYGKKRCFDTPLAEAGIVGSAIGMAIYGLKPVVEIQFSGFVLPAFNEIVAHAARYRNRSRGRFPLSMVIRMPYGGGIRALEHHSESIEALFAHIPGLKVVIPSTPYDTKGLMIAAIRDPDPVIFMEPKRIYRAFKQEVPDEPYTVEIGKANIIQPGTDLTLVAWGAMVREAQQAIDLLGDSNISIELIDLRTLTPLDRETLIQSVKKTGRFLVVHEAVSSFGPGAELISLIANEAFLSLEAPPSRLAGYDIPVPLPKGEHHFMITPEKIVTEIRRLVAY